MTAKKASSGARRREVLWRNTQDLEAKLVEHDGRIKRDLEALRKKGCDVPELLSKVEACILSDWFMRQNEPSWLELYGVKRREIPDLPDKLEEAAILVKRLNESVVLSVPKILRRGIRHLGVMTRALKGPSITALASQLENLPVTLNIYAKLIRNIGAVRAKEYSERAFLERLRQDNLWAVISCTIQDGWRRPYAALARILDAAHCIAAASPVFGKYLREEAVPYTADSLRKLHDRRTK